MLALIGLKQFHPYLTLGSTCGVNVWSVNAQSGTVTVLSHTDVLQNILFLIHIYIRKKRNFLENTVKNFI